MTINRTIAILAGTSLAALASPALQAQDIMYGGQVTVSMPCSGLGNTNYMDNKLGYGVGVHALVPTPFWAGSALEPRVDFTRYENSGRQDAKSDLFKAGLDYDYFFSRSVNDGIYAGLGAGYGSCSFIQNGTMDDHKNNVYFAAQTGWMFTRNFGAELRYTYAEYKPQVDGNKTTIDAPTLDASFICRF
jgi:hypothetical protein